MTPQIRKPQTLDLIQDASGGGANADRRKKSQGQQSAAHCLSLSLKTAAAAKFKVTVAPPAPGLTRDPRVDNLSRRPIRNHTIIMELPRMTKSTPQSRRKMAARTKLVHAGRDPSEQFGFVNTPIYRGSTVLQPDLESLEKRA